MEFSEATRVRCLAAAVISFGIQSTALKELHLGKSAAAQSLVTEADFDGKPGGSPFRKPVFQPPSLESFRAQGRHGLVRQHTIGTAAVRDDLMRGIDLGEPGFEVAEWDVHRAGKVPQVEFIRRTDVEYGHKSGSGLCQKLMARHSLKTVAIIEVRPDHPFDFGALAPRHSAQRLQ